MLDINLIRENPDHVRESQRRRGEDPEKLENLIHKDENWRETLTILNNLRKDRNRANQEIITLKKQGSDISNAVSSMKTISNRIKELEQAERDIRNERDRLLMGIPNILHESVPEGADENSNATLRYHGKARVHQKFMKEFEKETQGKMEILEIDDVPVSHVDFLDQTGFADIPRAAKVAGARFYYLRDQLVLLDLSLQRYALDFLSSKGYTIVAPPLMLNRKAIEGVTDLGTFEDTIYKIDDEDLYLIATSEHPLGAMFMDEFLEEDSLPVKMAGLSPCFRKEAGAHGKDTRGIFRVHQFNKVEQFIFCKPDDSWKLFDELINNAEELYRDLELPYRVMDICTGDLGTVASKKLDIEVWMPAQGKFREVVSASNALDYQARRLNMRFRSQDGNIMVHTLNSTAIATSRTMVAIIENFQEDGVITIPRSLRKYTGFNEIPMSFTKSGS